MRLNDIRLSRLVPEFLRKAWCDDKGFALFMVFCMFTAVGMFAAVIGGIVYSGVQSRRLVKSLEEKYENTHEISKDTDSAETLLRLRCRNRFGGEDYVFHNEAYYGRMYWTAHAKGETCRLCGGEDAAR